MITLQQKLKEEIERYMDLVLSWDLCDMYCKSVIIKRKDFESFILTWIQSQELYRKRAAFSLLASMSVHAVLTAKEIEAYLTLMIHNNFYFNPN